MAYRIGINGFGRIGRCVLRAGIDRDDIEFVGINDLTSAENLAYLLKYDSVHRTFPGEVRTEGDNALVINGKRIPISAERDPSQLKWSEWRADMIFECTGKFVDRASNEKHLEAGAKWVMVSAPAKGEDLTVCYGVNHQQLDPDKHRIISNASCTTNCLAPMAKVLNDTFGIEQGLMTTIHSYTNGQALLDSPDRKDIKRGRAAALSMIPTSTGAAKAVGLVLPELKGKLDGLAIRVPTPNVSLTDLSAVLTRPASAEQVNDALRKAAEGPFKGVIHYCTDEIVSIDAAGNPHSCVFIPNETRVIGNLVKVMAWYDNEWGFSNRMLDVVTYLISKS